MKYFRDLKFYRFNHLQDHLEAIDTRFNTYALNYLASGSILFQLNRRKPIIVNAPAVYWTWPGPRFKYEKAGDDPWEHYFISFTGKRPERWVKGGLLETSPKVEPVKAVSQSIRIRHEFDTILDLLATSPVWNPQAVIQLEVLLYLIKTEVASEAILHPRRDEMLALIGRIEGEPEAAYDFNAIAKQMHMTPAHLRRLFHLFAKCSPITFVNQTRMNEAALLLRTTQQPVKQVADALGYDDIYYFTRLFTRQFKLAPARYRKAFQRINENALFSDV